MTVARRLTVVWVLLTLVALGVPTGGIPTPGVVGVDKLAHAAIFLTGTVVALLGWPARSRRILLLLAIFAPLTEAWQAILPTDRTVEMLDVVANLIGILLGWLLVHRYGRSRGGDSPARGGSEGPTN